MTILEAFALPDEYMGNHCGLCGNSGWIDTVGKIFTAAGVGCGIKAPCLCANGRAIKRGMDRETQKGKRKPKPPQTFWVSWEDYSWKEPSKLGPKIISAWESGQAGDGSYATIVAWVIASNVAEVIAAIDRDYPCEGERRWRFINPCEPGWTTGDRFPLNKQAEAKLKKLKGRK